MKKILSEIAGYSYVYRASKQLTLFAV